MRITLPQDGPWVAARAVAAVLQDHGFAAWYVGGCVRDLLLGRNAHDVDLATDAVPETISGLFPRTVTVGKSFGVVVVVAPDGSHVEVATFRLDGRYLDHRRPESVRFGSAEEDVKRRDFTINALLLDPLSGELRDLVEGQQDLQARLVRCVGDASSRLAEDPLRVLRALRFAAVLAFAIEPATWSALRSTRLQGVSTERILQEWEKATHLQAARGRYLELLQESGRLSEVCPPLEALPAQELSRTLQAQGRLPLEAPFAVVMATTLALAPAAAVASYLQGLPLERTRLRQVSWLLEQRRALPRLTGVGVADRRRLARSPWAAGLSQLAQAHDEPQAGLLAQALAEERTSPDVVPLLGGDDLRELGIPAGPQLGALLKSLEDAQLEGRIARREQAVALVRAHLAARRPQE
jgi:poly(A) polymerase